MQLAEMLLLLGDRRRVWWRDLEGVFAGEERPTSPSSQSGRRSRAGRLRPRRSSSAGTAKRGRRRCVAHPNLRDDFLNVAIISEINRPIGHSGYRFAVCDNLGMPRAGW
jgi:hypothetical protein